MNVRLAHALDEARSTLSAPDQERLADLIAAFVASRAELPDLTAEELAELRRRHDEPFDPAPDHEVKALFDRLRG